MKDHLRVSDLQSQLTAQHIGQMREKFCLEDAANKGIRLLGRSDYNREPVILQLRGVNRFDSTNWNGPLRGDDELVVRYILGDNVDVSVGLI